MCVLLVTRTDQTIMRTCGHKNTTAGRLLSSVPFPMIGRPTGRVQLCSADGNSLDTYRCSLVLMEVARYANFDSWVA